ncbi:glycosyltransferase family 2 protein [Microbacterium sp. SORGH_AS_0888]|uniref:glycosyltransferase family 2 protein n=1 Tax=Microbacterium sp. SORGH_AS_0888 TaxID=3041791 RepID=UPI00278538A2|nr:glycosyltransferase family 2 protein [Microbacterium sp. SORGH_AS_0888]MDQ1128156.1 glycosyltransferase involved in cell wall biosynthesis [Microbacterium sp. SORGH_AS_0888]
MNPVVTIVVPGHDVAPYAPDALASLRAQTFPAWTAVLVDDGSSDGTSELFAAAAAADPRFRVVRHPARRGLGSARNTGVSLVDTPFLGFLDADDVLLPDALTRLTATLDASGSDFVAGAYVRLAADDAGAYSPGPVQPWVQAATDPARLSVTIDEHPEASGNVVAWSKLVRTDFWRRARLRFPEGRLYEDQVLAQLMYCRARRFDVVPDVVVHWRVRAEGTSITQQEDRLDVLRDCLDAMREGLAILDAADHPLAAGARVRLLLRMDVPRLARIAAGHPEDEYRRMLGTFARMLAEHPQADPADLSSPLVSAARLW